MSETIASSKQQPSIPRDEGAAGGGLAYADDVEGSEEAGTSSVAYKNVFINVQGLVHGLEEWLSISNAGIESIEGVTKQLYELRLMKNALIIDLEQMKSRVDSDEAKKERLSTFIEQLKGTIESVQKRVEEKLGKNELPFDIDPSSYDEIKDTLNQVEESLNLALNEIKDNDNYSKSGSNKLYIHAEKMAELKRTIYLWNVYMSQLVYIFHLKIMEKEQKEDYSVDLVDQLWVEIGKMCDERDKKMQELGDLLYRLGEGFGIEEFATMEERLSIYKYGKNHSLVMGMHAALKSPATDEIVNWNDDGTEVVIDPRCFGSIHTMNKVAQVLNGSYILGNNNSWPNFLNTLQKWGFKVRHHPTLRFGSNHYQITGFYHPLFQRATPNEALRMRYLASTFWGKSGKWKEGKDDPELKCCGGNCDRKLNTAYLTYYAARTRGEETFCPWCTNQDDGTKSELDDEVEETMPKIKEFIEQSKPKLEQKEMENQYPKGRHKTGKELLGSVGEDLARPENLTDDQQGWWDFLDDTNIPDDLGSWSSLGKYDNDVKKLTGFTTQQIMKKEGYERLRKNYRKHYLFRSMFYAASICCGGNPEDSCGLPVPGRDEDYNVITDGTSNIKLASSPYAAHHLHHCIPINKSGNANANLNYIDPSKLHRKKLSTAELMYHFCRLQVMCAGCHDQHEALELYEIDHSHRNKGYYTMTKEYSSLAEILDEKDGPYQLLRQAIDIHNLDSKSPIAPRTRKELDVIVFNTTGFLPCDLVTWAAESVDVWDNRTSYYQGYMKQLAWNLIQKLYGRCMGRGQIKCLRPDIINEVPQRMTMFHGDHGGGEGTQNKSFDPSQLRFKGWETFEEEVRKLEGNIKCSGCHDKK